MPVRRLFALLSVLVAPLTVSHVRGDEAPRTLGRVRISIVGEERAARIEGLRQTLDGRFAAPPGQTFPSERVISVRPRTDAADIFDVTLYDYTAQQGFDAVMDSQAREISRAPLPFQPDLSEGELSDAMAVVAQRSAWSEAISKGTYQVYPPMPGISTDEKGRRLVNVGVLSSPSGTSHLADNEVVSVDLSTGKVIRYASGAPETSATSLLTCNPPPSSGCGASSGTCAYYHVEWPAANPVWKLNLRHPSCTDSVQGSGTGLELTDVYYNDVLILQRAEVPVLNVLYQGNTCGPYRDWLDSEDCFQATGTDAAPGIRVTTGNPTPYTFCEADPPSDAGNFKGVAVHDQGDALYLLTETNAGWYRYVMEWRLYLNGTIEPIFGFGATSNGCTCNLHFHHAYWRFEWAIGGVSGNTSTGIDTLERRRAGTQDQYDPVTAEGTFIRPTTNPENDWFRVRSVQTQSGYLIEPGAHDGNASGDAYGKWDLAAVAYTAGQIDDPNSDTSINISPWVNGEALGTTKRLVTWYHATYAHNGNEDPEPCELAGPKLVFFYGCAGTVGLDHSVYACGAPVGLSVDDSDLRGSGTVSVSVTSTTESTPETISLSESPAGSGHFVGTIGTITGAAVGGDGKLSVANGDTISARYVDASACGTPNVNIDKTAPVDCASPGLSGLQAINVTSSTASIVWTTNESSTSTVHYGTTPPGAGSVSSASMVTSHGLPLTGLASCTTYYYWVESTDAAGNTTMSNANGGYADFRTGTVGAPTSYASTDTPVSVPDNNPTGGTSTITVSDPRPVQDANVRMNMTHTYDGDLVLSLIAPNSATVALSTRRGSGGDNFINTVFDDEATTPISAGSAPFTGSFIPESPLTGAEGIPGSGAWRLKVVDQAGADTGTIDSWTLTLTYPASCSAAGGPPPVPDGHVGTAMTASRADTAGSKIHVVWDAATCHSSNYHLLYGLLSGVSSYTLGGGVCDLGPIGAYDWGAVPAGSLWYVVVGDDPGGKEGSWGRSSSGAEMGGAAVSGQCGLTVRDNTPVCH